MADATGMMKTNIFIILLLYTSRGNLAISRVPSVRILSNSFPLMVQKDQTAERIKIPENTNTPETTMEKATRIFSRVQWIPRLNIAQIKFIP